MSAAKAKNRATTGGGKGLNPAALSVAQLARVLNSLGAPHATVKTLRRHIKAGAPVNPDGTMDLIHYAAWLVRELAIRGG